MTSSVPYLIRAMNEWILDNTCTPYLVVDAGVDGVSVPVDYVKDGQIVLNISPTAVRNLLIDDEAVSFSGRFGGVAHQIYAPVPAVLGIVSRENGEGMWFPKEDAPVNPDPTTPPSSDPPADKPTLRVVK
ncbi:MAG: ClpXP protease specificity-enhancing factor [Proteobacteria bacterium]|nr:ClpXP protease specificity-enhancing factor [Pseudomonadota bacterium]MDA1299104.1 ClpXP protease specificity-enhancing factor [Pseudomonadota bacterium]